MTKYDDALSPFIGAMERRSLLKLFGRSAIAIAGSAAPGLQALAQRLRRNHDTVEASLTLNLWPQPRW